MQLAPKCGRRVPLPGQTTGKCEPGEEPLGERIGIHVGAESFREVRPVLEGLELRFGEGVLVGDVGPGMPGHHA
jgi:hypothetical protein